MHVSGENRKRLALSGLICGLAMIFLDSTVLPVAAPTIQAELKLTTATINWIINAYFLATATLVLAFGRFADRIGHRRIFALGMSIFALASAMGGFANGSGWLMISRSLQGIGGAMMSPASWAIIIDTFPFKERGRAMGILVGVSSLFLCTGPSIGGFLTEVLSWRWIFWINLPIAIMGVILVLVAVKKNELSEESFDIPGFLTFALGVGSLTIALMQGRAWGWGSPVTITLFSVAVIFLLLLFLTDRYAKHPFIDFKLYLHRIYRGGSLLVFLAQFVMTASIFWPIFFQKALNMSPLAAGGVTLISTVPILAAAPLSGWMQDRLGPFLPIFLGFCLQIASLVSFAILVEKGNITYLIPSLLLFGTGIALYMPPNSTSTLAALPPRKNGLGSGMFYTARFTGGTLGIALLGSLISNLHYRRFWALVAEIDLPTSFIVSGLWKKIGNGAIHDPQFQALPEVTQNLINNAYLKSYEFSFTMTHFFAALVAVIALIVAIRTYYNYSHESN